MESSKLSSKVVMLGDKLNSDSDSMNIFFRPRPWLHKLNNLGANTHSIKETASSGFCGSVLANGFGGRYLMQLIIS